MIIPDPNLNNPKRKIVVDLIKTFYLPLYISRGTDKNAAPGSDHIKGNAFDVGSSVNKSYILRFYSWLKDHPDRLKKLGISSVLLGTVQPHIHIGFNPKWFNKDGSTLFGYEKKLATGKIIADTKYPGLDIIQKLYPNKPLVYVDDKRSNIAKWWEGLTLTKKIKYSAAGLGVLILLPYVYNYLKKFKKD